MKKGLTITLSFMLLTALLIVTRNDSIDVTNKLPLVTSLTTMTGEYYQGGSVCLQFTTIIPDKFSEKVKMDCRKRVK